MGFSGSYDKKPKIIRGIAMLQPEGESGYFDLGNTTTSALTITPEELERTSSRGPVAEVLDNFVTKISRSLALSTDDLPKKTLALFLSATENVAKQSSSVVTNELHFGVTGRYYQMGETTNNPTGVSGVTGVSINLDDSVSRANSTAYSEGDYIYDGSSNVHVCSVAGTSSGAAPAFNTTNIGDTTTDGSVTWVNIGPVAALTLNTDYELDAEKGMIFASLTGAIADAFAVLPETGTASKQSGVPLHFDYTATANSRNQVVTGQATTVKGKLKIIEDNAAGENDVWFMGNVSVVPNGDLPMMSSDSPAYQVAAFNIKINKPQIGEAITVNGVPY